MKAHKYSELKKLISKSLRLFNRGKYSSAIETSGKALAVSGAIPDNIHSDLGTLYGIIGGSYMYKSEHEKALNYLHLSLKEFISANGKNDIEVAKVYNNLAVCYSVKTRYIDNPLYVNKIDIRNSLQNYRKSLSIMIKASGTNNTDIASVYNNMSIVSFRGGYKKISYKYLHKSNEIYLELCGKNSIEAATSFHNLGVHFYNINQFKESIKFLKKSVKIFIKLKNHELLLSLKYRVLSLNYIKLKKYREAGYYIDKAIHQHALLHKLLPDKILELQPYEGLLELMYFQGSIKFLKYKFGNKKADDLKHVFDHFKNIINTIEKIRNGFFCDGSKNIFSVKTVIMYEKAIEVCIELYKIHNDGKYIEQAYMYSQKSKSLSLIENIKDYDAKISSNIPDDVLKKEINLKKKISDYEKLLYEEIKNTGKSQIKTAEIRNTLFNLKQRLETLIKNLEKDYPEYYNIKYDFKAATFDEIKNHIPDDTMIIEYFLGDESIFAFVFTKDECFINQIKKSKSFGKKISDYRSLLTGVNSYPDENTIIKYKKLSYYFYKILIKNILKPEPGLLKKDLKDRAVIKNILIIPDNELNFIPFDSLIVNNNEGGSNFKDLPYLIKYFNIIFSYSIILYLKSIHDSYKKKRLNILAFAPVFKNHNRKLNRFTENFRDSLTALNHNKKEVKEISKYFNGNYYFDTEAVKDKFMKSQKQFSILHFATHSVVDSENPMYSKIVFSKSDKEKDEGFLHTYEIYSLNSKYDLVVLSACNTGFGRMIRGEGIMSIARAFAASGSKNIVMSLWQVNDKSTSEIMKMFYRNIARGERVGEALRNAKLKYLKNSDGLKSLPFYWSPFISFGINNSLNKN